MAYSALILAAALPLVFGAPIASSGTGFVSLPLRRELVKNANSTIHRRGAEEGPLGFNAVRYLADFTLGGQSQSNAIMDTGSSNTWVTKQSYDSSKSSTYEYINSNYGESYGYGGTSVSGTWGTDTLNFGDVTLADFQFGVLDSAPQGIGAGIFAMGPRAGESDQEAQYPTLYEALKNQGTIQSNSFSLFISKEDQSEATLIFGGVDQAKYSGPLYTIPLDTKESYGTSYYAVDFKFDNVEYSGGVLDSGTPEILLPNSVADSLAQTYGGTWSAENECYIANTKVENPPSQTVEIGGISVTIPGDEFYLDGDQPGPYQLGVSRAVGFDETTFLNILGEPFMRHLYLVYDLDTEQIAFAPVKYTEDSNIVAIGSSIPGTTPAPDQSVGSGEGSTGSQPENPSNNNCFLGIFC